MIEGVVSRIEHGDEPFSLDPRLPWWEALPEDFFRRRDRFSLGLRDRTYVGTTAAADVVLRTLGAALVGLLAFPLGYNPVTIRRSMRARELYEGIARSGDRTRFFAQPSPVRISLRPAHGNIFRPKDGTCEDIHFESPFVPVLESERARYLRHRENRIAHARIWRHRQGPRPTVIALHGFSADLYNLNEWFFALPWLYARGCDVVCVTLPFHGRRQTRFSPFSGHGFFAGGLSRLNEAFAQAVLDVRILMDWLLQTQGAPAVGATGVSLGGFTSALLASVEPRLAFVIPNVPVTSIADLVLEWEPIGLATRTTMRAFRQSIVDIRAALAPSSPLTWAPLVPKERRMIIGGVADRLAPPKHSRLLWEHWDRCAIHWFPGSHLLHLDRGFYLREMGRFLGRLQFLPPRARGG